jgi:release factor glutamine methyltransferase
VVALEKLIREARDRLEVAKVENAAFDARLLVEHFTGTTRTDAVVRPEREITEDAVERVRAALARRLSGEPVHRILGRREFYGLELGLSPTTLEPRPDTEILVDRIAPLLKRMPPPVRILDLGTGTGAIALALLSVVPEAMAVGADVAPEAVETAVANAARNGFSERFEGVVSDWFSAINGKFHAIVSNPPYIEAQELASLPQEVRLFDPQKALDGGHDGLDAYRVIAKDAGSFLERDGLIGVETGFRQHSEVTAVFGRAGFALVDAGKDLSGLDRTLIFKTVSGANDARAPS